MATAEPRSAGVREAILLAAAIEFDARGYAGTSIASIAARAGTVKGHVQYYFHAKADIATSLIHKVFEGGAFLSPVEGGPELRGVAAVLASVRSVASRFCHDVVARAAVRLLAERAEIGVGLPTPYIGWMTRVAHMLEQARDDGEVAAEVNAQEDGWLLVAAFYGVLLVAQTLDALDELPLRAERVVSLLLASLR